MSATDAVDVVAMPASEENGPSLPRVVCQILPELNEGGVERGTLELSAHLVRRGIESVVISRGGRGVEQLRREGGRHVAIDVCSKNPLTAPRRAWQLRTALAAIAPDVIHARSRVPAWLCKLANRRPRRPLVTTVHGLNRINRYSRVMVSGDRVIAVSEVVRDYVCEGYSIAPESVRVVQRGVDLSQFDPAAVNDDWIAAFRARHGLGGRFVVASVGRVTWLKDYESLIRATALCRDRLPNLTTLIVGGARSDKADYLAGLRELAEREGVADRVVFTGSVAEVREVYALSDVVVNASLKMGNMGRTVVEALAMDRPVIATTWPGLNNLVQDGVNGQVIETQQPDQLAEALCHLAERARSSCGFAPGSIRATVPREFTLEAMVDNVLAVYCDLLRETGPNPG